MKLCAAGVIALVLSGCTALETSESRAWLALHAVDAIQTYHAAQQPQCFEEGDALTRRLIGIHPSEGEVAAWAIASAAIHVGVTELLLRNDSPRLAKAWQYVSIGVTADAIVNNHSVGIRIGSPNQPRKGSCAAPALPGLPDRSARPVG